MIKQKTYLIKSRGPEWEAISILGVLSDWEYLEEVREKVALLTK